MKPEDNPRWKTLPQERISIQRSMKEEPHRISMQEVRQGKVEEEEGEEEQRQEGERVMME